MAWGDPSTIQPLGDRVLVESIKETETRGGVVIPEMAQGRPERARVLAVGPGLRHPKTGERQPLDVEVGDIVVFHRMAGSHIGGFDDDFIVFREQDILARITDEET
jgi:chaperonin GroES